MADSVERFRERNLPPSFSEYHSRALDLCLGRVQPRAIPRKLNAERLDVTDLTVLAAMAELELVTSVESNKKGTEEGTTEPHVFDVYLMETTFDRRNANLAVCVPIRNDLWWYDGEETLWALDPPSHKWRVASLSGTARILEALLEPSNIECCPLMLSAMKREQIVIAEEDTSFAHVQAPTLVHELNESQKQAVATVICERFKEGFFVIQGPPGCGKTSTLAAMAATVGEGVLVAAPSNAAVGNAAIRLYDSGCYYLQELSVFGENVDSKARFMSPRFRGEEYAKFLEQHDNAKTVSEKDSLKRAIIKWLHLDESQEYSLAQLGALCPFIDMSTREGRRYLSQALFQSKVVFSTLNSLGSKMLRESVRAHTLMLDEAGQCPEAEFYIATTVPGVRRLVVMGDPMQLPATVVDQGCKAALYGVSWLECIHRVYPERVHLLNIQYRMHVDILEFPNNEFYQGRIMSGDNVLVREPTVEKPFLFYDCTHKGQEEREGFSFVNPFEVAVIKNILFCDSDVKGVREHKVNARIIVISPYKAQVKLLRDALKVQSTLALEVATVDSFQGQEADIVIISTVRTSMSGL